MTPVYVIRLGFVIKTTNISAQKIDKLLLKIYKMITTKFLLQNRLEKI